MRTDGCCQSAQPGRPEGPPAMPRFPALAGLVLLCLAPAAARADGPRSAQLVVGVTDDGPAHLPLTVRGGPPPLAPGYAERFRQALEAATGRPLELVLGPADHEFFEHATYSAEGAYPPDRGRASGRIDLTPLLDEFERIGVERV